MALLSSGTPKKVIIVGMPFDVTADCKPQSNFTGVTTEANATSGGVVFKDTKQPCYIKGIDLTMSVQTYNLLCQMIAAVPKPYAVGLMYADMTVSTYPGAVNLGDHDGADNKVTADIYFENKPIVAG
jgi:hypothetical protein